MKAIPLTSNEYVVVDRFPCGCEPTVPEPPTMVGGDSFTHTNTNCSRKFLMLGDPPARGQAPKIRVSIAEAIRRRAFLQVFDDQGLDS